MIKPVGADRLLPLYIDDDAERNRLIAAAADLPAVVVSSATAANAVMLGGGPYSTYQRVHNVMLESLPDFIDPEQGTIEVWYKQLEDPVAYSHNVYRIFGGSYGLGSRMYFVSTSPALGAEPRLYFALSFGGTWTHAKSLADGQLGVYISHLNDTWIHLAAVWDRAGVDGSPETIRLYIDGEKVAATTGSSWGTAVGPRADICGANDNSAGNFHMDNLVLWGCAKTDFSDRFTEEPEIGCGSPNQPPVADAGPDETVECTDAERTAVLLDGSGSYDPDGDPLDYEWTFEDGGRVLGEQPTVLLPLGTYAVTLTVDDGYGGTDDDDVVKSVEDTAPPEILSLIASPEVLWPPNHKMRSVHLDVTSFDLCDSAPPSCRIVGVRSSEPADGLGGDGDTAPDWVITGDLTLQLRAERAGTGGGRTYTLDVACQDASGNSSEAIATVWVPHSR